MWEQFPYTFGKYRVEAEIGRGGFGTVYHALDTNLDRPVAVKIMDPIYLRDRRWIDHFRREAKVMAKLDHPSIVPIYDTGELNGRLFLAMKYVDGPNLAQIIEKEGGLSWDRVVEIMDQISSALDYAHQRDIIHRDLKPANILISDQKAMLTDFGLAKILDENSQSISVSGGIAGTYNYMAPEVFNNEEVTFASDIYALGCLVFEMLVGHKLFEGQSTAAIVGAHLKGIKIDEPLPPGTPPGTLHVLQTALAKDPGNRFHSAGAVAQEMVRLTTDRLKGPYAALLQAIVDERWADALDLSTEISARDANYRDIVALEERAIAGQEAAQRQRWADEWRSSAEKALAAGKFDEGRGALNQWQRVAPDDPQIERVEKELLFAEKYAALKQLVNDGNWQAAQPVAAEIYNQNPSYRDISGLQATIKSKLDLPLPPTSKRIHWLPVVGGIVLVSFCLILIVIGRSIMSDLQATFGLGDFTKTPVEEDVGPLAATEKPAEAAVKEEPSKTYLDRAFSGEYSGREVTISGSSSNHEIFVESFASFSKATGINVQYIGDGDFENTIASQVESGSAPDIGTFTQPGLVQNFARQGYVVNVLGYMSRELLEERYNSSWLSMVTVTAPEGEIMGGVWHRVGPKGLVFYRQDLFEAAGYAVPQSWADLITLTQRIAADGHTAWCIGMESGWANGWVATDWTEAVLLRKTSLKNYDAWINGDLPFTSPQVRAAIETWSEIWLNPDYVYGGVDSIVSTFFGDSPAPMFADPPGCYMHMQGIFITEYFPANAQYGQNYGVFILPPIAPAYGTPLLIGGNIMTQFKDRDEVRAVMEYFTTPDSVLPWMEKGVDYSPHRQASPELYSTELTREIAGLIAESKDFRFDGSDLMPKAVGTDAFFEMMTAYVNGEVDLESALQEIDAAWPR